MNQSLSPAELEQRFAEINAREPEELTAEEAAALAEAEIEGVSLNQYMLYKLSR